MVEPDNGQRDDRKPYRHNAKHCPFDKRQRVINALAHGYSMRAIARMLRVSFHTIAVIREQEWQQLAARKQRIAAEWESVADTALDHLNDQLQIKGHTLAPNVLAPIAGIATDKILALRGEPALIIQHQHDFRLCRDDLLAFALYASRSSKSGQEP